MSNIRGIPGEINIDGNIYKGIETESTTTHVNNFTKEISVNVKDDYFNEKLETKQDKLIAGEGIEIDENNEISVKRAEDTLEITSEDITIEDDKIVFNSDVAQEIMSMNKRLKVDASIVDPRVAQGKFIAVFTPRAIIDYSLPEGTIVYEYSTTNWLIDAYRTTYVEFRWDATTEKLYVSATAPAKYEDHIVGFSTESTGGVELTSNIDMRTSRINTLRINDFDTVSVYNQPSLEFNANGDNELESIVFKQDSSYADFTYTIPKGAKHYVVSELPTQDIDEHGDYFVLTESEDAREYLSTDISNLSQSEYPSTNPNTLRQDPAVNGSDFTKLQVSEAGTNKFRGDFAIKFNIPCAVLITLNPTQPYGSYMYLDVNGVNELLITAGHTYDYARNFNVGETLYVRGECTSILHNLYYKLAIQPYTIDGKIPLNEDVLEYVNKEGLWFKVRETKPLYHHFIRVTDNFCFSIDCLEANALTTQKLKTDYTGLYTGIINSTTTPNPNHIPTNIKVNIGSSSIIVETLLLNLSSGSVTKQTYNNMAVISDTVTPIK